MSFCEELYFLSQIIIRSTKIIGINSLLIWEWTIFSNKILNIIVHWFIFFVHQSSPASTNDSYFQKYNLDPNYYVYQVKCFYYNFEFHLISFLKILFVWCFRWTPSTPTASPSTRWHSSSSVTTGPGECQKSVPIMKSCQILYS